MAISKCKELIVSRKRFSDFTLFDPVAKDDIENIFLAGYIEQEDGGRENIKIKASTFVDKSTLGTAVGTLKWHEKHNDFSFKYENSKKIVELDSTVANFIQINKLDSSLFNTIDGKKYVILRLSDEITFGTVLRFYFPNFPTDCGVKLCQTPAATATDADLVEVFFNDVPEQMASDFYFTVIQLADPFDIDGKIITNKTKVIEVNNITTELESVED